MADGAKVGSIYYDLDLDDKKFRDGASSVKSELKGIEGAFSSAEAGSKLFLGTISAIGAAGIAAVGFGVKVAGDLEAARQGFVALLGSAEKADETMARIKKEAAATPFELTGLVAGGQALTAITKDGNKAVDILLDVGKAIATSGKGQAELDRVILNLQQIASTGKVTAMDIRQFQSAIPMFNDIMKSAGMTTAELLDSEDAAGKLFEAFKKAGAEGGITSQGFAAQAGTFNQLWSNLVDTVTIGASEFVKTSGIFDAVKNALSGVIDTINKFTTPEAIEGFIDFIVANGPIFVGIIIGGITPALVGMAVALWGLMAPLIPFIAIGAAIGLAIKLIVDAMGGWDNATKMLTEAWTMIVDLFNAFIMPALQELWNVIATQLLPELQKLWEQLSPILIPVLQILGAILVGVVLVAIRVVIEIIKMLVQWVTTIVSTVNWGITQITNLFNFLKNDVVKKITELVDTVTEWFNKLPTFVKNAISGLADIITKPFRDAWSFIEPILNKIKEGLDKINPFHRESPSLVDNVRMGVEEIMYQYARLGRIDVPNINSLAGLPALATAGGSEVNQDIDIHIGNVGDQQDISAIGRELGFRAGILPR